MGLGHLQVLVKGISHVTATPVASLGDRVLLNGEEYVYFYNASSDLTAKVGYGVVASSATGWSCVISHVTASLFPVGIVKHVDVPVGEYGWALKSGFAPISAGLNTGLAVNDELHNVATTNTGNISRKTLNSATSNEAFRSSPFGVVIAATSTGGQATAKVWL